MPRPRVVIVGAGFAGFETARRLTKQARGALDIAILNPTDYFLYLPLLPEVSAGRPRPAADRRLAGRRPCRGVRIVLGAATTSTSPPRTIAYTDPDGTAAPSPTTGWCSPPAA